MNISLETWCKENNRLDLLDEWDYEANEGLTDKFGTDISTPNLISRASNIKVGWVCSTGHHYKSKVRNRTTLNTGCPYCSNHSVLKGYNDFESWCEQNSFENLLDEWDYERNAVKPDTILSGYSKKVWWIGKCGHSWDSLICVRTASNRPGGCPYCSNPPKRVLIGFNDLKTWAISNNKEYILDEWDYDKNYPLVPESFTYGSGKAVWWKCNKNHVWKTSITNRQHHMCPICSRQQTSFPEQAIYYYVSKHYDVLQRYRINGYEADLYIESIRTAIEYDGAFWHNKESSKQTENLKNKNFAENRIRLIRIKENKTIDSIQEQDDMISFNPAGLYNTSIFDQVLEKLFHLLGFHSESSFNILRDENAIRMQYMSYLKDNSVASKYPELISEWDVEKNDGMTPDIWSAHNRQKVWWKCKNGHSWGASIVSRTASKHGCPFCAGQKVISGINDFETWCKDANPVLLEQWDYNKNEVKPSEIPRTFKEKVYWKCDEGHSWSATVYNRVNGTGCPICNTGNDKRRKSISFEQWCKSNNKPQLLDEWNFDKNDGLTPATVSYGSHKKVWWKCASGHSWEAQIKSRTYNHGCPYCSGTNHKAVEGVNDLETWCYNNHKEYILREWNSEKNEGLLPNKVTYGSHRKINWVCEYGHEWQAIVKERTKQNGNMCPICRNH